MPRYLFLIMKGLQNITVKETIKRFIKSAREINHMARIKRIPERETIAQNKLKRSYDKLLPLIS